MASLNDDGKPTGLLADCHGTVLTRRKGTSYDALVALIRAGAGFPDRRVSNDPFPDPQEIVSSLLSQSKKPVAFGPSASEERRLGHHTTVFTILGHAFEAHDIQRQRALRHLVDNAASGLAETVAAEKHGESSRAYLRGRLGGTGGHLWFLRKPTEGQGGLKGVNLRISEHLP